MEGQNVFYDFKSVEETCVKICDECPFYISKITRNYYYKKV